MVRKEKYFLLHNGQTIKDIFELSKALGNMPEDIFRYHVNENKNDFSNWIRDAVQNKELADKVQNVKDMKQMKQIIGERIQKTVLKKMEKKPKPKEITKKEIISKIKPKIEKKTQWSKEKLLGFFRKQVPKTKIDPRATKFGIECPSKTFHCGVLEFVFGIIIGLLTALIITNLI